MQLTKRNNSHEPYSDSKQVAAKQVSTQLLFISQWAFIRIADFLRKKKWLIFQIELKLENAWLQPWTDFAGKNAIVLAIPRGGVVVGYEIAKALNLPLDVIIPRKIGAPDNPELAIGAMTEDGTIILDENLSRT